LDFVVFSDDWGRRPSPPQHLFARVARAHRVLWVETLGLRMPRLLSGRDLLRVGEKLASWLRPAPPPEVPPLAWPALPPLLTRVAPPMHPFLGWPPAAAVDDAWLAWLLRRRLDGLDMRRPVLVSSIPTMAGLLGRLGERAAVYLCVDDFALWPGYAAATIRRREAVLLDRMTALATTSEALRAARARPGVPHFAMPQGADIEHFAGGAGRPIPEPLRGLPRPVLLFAGKFDERVDQELLVALCARRPDATIVLLGERTVPIVRSLEQSRAAGRVRIHERVPYGELPAWLAAADVLLIPYLRNAQTETIQPLKLREYLASGRPVASTALPEVARAAGALVDLGDGPGSFAAAVERALARPPSESASRRAAVQDFSWEAVARRFLAWIDTLPGIAAP
jgi:glycosyltransferase involved in cell wall biosynthesis